MMSKAMPSGSLLCCLGYDKTMITGQAKTFQKKPKCYGRGAREMANQKSASKPFSELRQRAEKAVQKRALDNLDDAERSNKEMQGLIHEL
jgi:hypothetical protein